MKNSSSCKPSHIEALPSAAMLPSRPRREWSLPSSILASITARETTAPHPARALAAIETLPRAEYIIENWKHEFGGFVLHCRSPQRSACHSSGSPTGGFKEGTRRRAYHLSWLSGRAEVSAIHLPAHSRSFSAISQIVTRMKYRARRIFHLSEVNHSPGGASVCRDSLDNSRRARRTRLIDCRERVLARLFAHRPIRKRGRPAPRRAEQRHVRGQLGDDPDLHRERMGPCDCDRPGRGRRFR